MERMESPASGGRPRTAVLSKRAARRFGEDLRDLRVIQRRTTADCARLAGLSATYLNNIERGAKLSIGREAFRVLPVAYGVPVDFIRDLWFRAQIESALENRGLDNGAREQVWRSVEAVMDSLGYRMRDMVARQIADLRREHETGL